jgi:hypothetical protein
MYSDPFFVHTNKMLKLLQASGHLISRTKTQSTSLARGNGTTSMRVQAPRVDLVVKQSDTTFQNQMVSNSPDQEALALKALSTIGVSPDYVDYLPDTDGGPVLVRRYYDGETWQDDCASVGRLLSTVHNTVHNKVHNTAFNAEILDGFRSLTFEPSEILAQAENALIHVDDDVINKKRLHEHTPDPIEHPGLGNLSLINANCGPGNMIQNDDQVILINWQGCGLGDPVEDLCCFLSPGNHMLDDRPALTQQCVEIVLDAYNDPHVIERFHQLRFFYQYRFMAYCLYQSVALQQSDRDAAARYDRAFAAELEMVEAIS